MLRADMHAVSGASDSMAYRKVWLQFKPCRQHAPLKGDAWRALCQSLAP
jgi:hypothetical protein